MSYLREVSLDTYRGERRKISVICPSCGKKGFLTRRWVESQYYPQFVSLDIDMLEDLKERVKKYPDNTTLQARLKIFEKKVKGKRYSGPKKKFLIKPDDESMKDKNGYYRVTYKKYYYYYIGHYNKEIYNKNIERYKKGEIKSRPNGRIWHKVHENDYYETYDKNGNKVIEIGKGIRRKFMSRFL